MSCVTQQQISHTMMPTTPSALAFAAPIANVFSQTAQERANIDLGHVLDDLAVRFIVNWPGVDADAVSEELMLLMFEVEKAHWFYLDFWRQRDLSLPELGIREFTRQLFHHCAMLQTFAQQADSIVSEWQAYKKGVPTCGACILNDDLSKVLLVRGWNAKSWGWPKGKVNKGECDATCAAREVEEEIGLDILPYLDEANTIQTKVGEQLMKLYVIPYVPETTAFATKTRQEISEIAWHKISDVADLKTFSVAPVLGKLRSWVSGHRRALSRSNTPVRRTNSSSSRATKLQSESSAPERSSQSPGRSSARQQKRDKKSKGRLVESEVDAAGVARDNNETFGDTYKQIHQAGFSVEEMFKANEEKFGIISTYSFDQYTTALPGANENKPKGMLYAERFRTCTVADVQQTV